MLRAYCRAIFILLGLQIWIRLVFLAGSISLIRIESLEWMDLGYFLLNSVRFDLMVAGYLLCPFLIISLPSIFISKWKPIANLLLKWNLLLATGSIVLISILDVYHFSIMQDHFNSLGLEYLRSLGFQFTWLFPTAALFIVYCGARTFQIIRKHNFNNIKGYSLTVWFMIIVLTSVLIRSSFSEHHLDLRHAEVTHSRELNRVIIPSTYALDQALRKRR